ncbi:MAG: hypothetical protein GQ538_00275 [Xanthomonadales bacterium]|nr:hypothetical protein [Xanthomonadales bacterium]
MAIVNCPNCDNSISSLTTVCPYCGFERDEFSEEKLKESRRRTIRDQIYRLRMASYGALSLLLIAFAWYMTDTAGFQQRASVGPYILFTVGAAIYLVIRALLFKAALALKKIRY